MKKFLLPALAATLLLAATAVAAPLDAFKGMKGTLDIAGGTAHIPVMKEAAKRIIPAWAYSRWVKGSSRSATRAAR